MQKENKIRFALILPCYNEEEILSDSIAKLLSLFDELIQKKPQLAPLICCVDDGSHDNTWEIINKLCAKSNYVTGIKLSSNFGHQGALMAGINFLRKDTEFVITIDADLQDDISVISEMIEKYLEGADIVYGVRDDRKTDSFFKRKSAIVFYMLMKKLGVDIVFNHADYRLSSQKVNAALDQYQESNLFLRGIFPLMGFNHASVYYSRKERLAGETKYPLSKMLAFAFDGISSFSIKPLRWITSTGFIVFIGCIIASVYAIISYLSGEIVPGWFSTVLPFYFLGGIQILCVGIIGEYLGKIYKEVKRRPRYIIEKTV
jgi:glycosyltransferase involved in cell wall biosynthesis